MSIGDEYEYGVSMSIGVEYEYRGEYGRSGFRVANMCWICMSVRLVEHARVLALWHFTAYGRLTHLSLALHSLR